ncbi:MAG: hypothetical protein IJS40_08815 [Synergistaceae bacterium]|nr:hypothetical protein [Synergistaceae bacterium]
MVKKFSALVLIFVLTLPFASFAEDAFNYQNTDPFHFSVTSGDLNLNQTPTSYSTYGFGDMDFFYQVRDITGERWVEKVGGPQWFATIYENYTTTFNANEVEIEEEDDYLARRVYRRTLGGEIDDIRVSTIGDIIDGFNFVFIEEPEPYEAWLNTNLGNYFLSVYDKYPDPLESLCIITTDGSARLNLDFANPYARHFPFWWNWRNTINQPAGVWWWQNMYSWTDIMPNLTVEPVAYIYNHNDNGIYQRNSVYQRFDKVYDVVNSGDVLYISANGVDLYKSSGDITGAYLICSGDTVYCQVSGDAIYSPAGDLLYTVEHTADETDTCDYLCEPRSVGESILVQGFDDYNYTVAVTPTSEQEISSMQALPVTINIRGDADNYGSALGYITFRQRATFMPGYTNFREASPIPIVFANVSRGNAADNPLIFDLTIKDGSRVVKRTKFKWSAQENLPNQDLGTFFLMRRKATDYDPYKNYTIETKITNRTGTRYMLYRYDRAVPGEESINSTTYPSYWKYDLTEDTYGTLPKKFWLDTHSQIAPGLVTVYDETLDMNSDTTSSFRLYEYNYANPKELWLNYKRVANVYTDFDYQTLDSEVEGGAVNAAASAVDSVAVQTFYLDFADIISNDENTENEIQTLTGKLPILNDVRGTSEGAGAAPAPGADSDKIIARPQSAYISAAAMNSFQISENFFDLDLFNSVVAYANLDEISDDVEDDEESQEEDTDEVKMKLYKSSSRMAVMPVAIRLAIPRKSQLLRDIWNDLDAAESPRELFTTFNKFGTVWVRSSATAERDADLFKAIGEKGNALGVQAADCVSAFLYRDDDNGGEDYLYLDFMVFMADAVSKNTSKTAFVEIFKDDNVPYVIVGDGDVDAQFDLTFYVAAPGDVSLSTNSTTTNTDTQTSLSGSDSGGGACNLGFAFVPLVLGLALTKFRK